MDVVTLGSGLSQPLLQDSLSPGGSKRAGQRRAVAELSSPASRPPQLQAAAITDRVELSGDSLLYYASQEISFQSSTLQVRPDGTYFYRQVSLEARQDILLALNFGPGGAANIDLEAVQTQLEEMIRDLQEGFQDSLRGLVQSLQARQPRIQPSLPLPLEDFLTDDVKALLSEYLVLIRQLAGEDSTVGRLAARLEAMLGLSESAGAVKAAQLSGQSLRVEFSQVEFSSTRITVTSSKQQVQEAEPLVLDLDGDGVELRSMEQGVRFDIDNDGRAEQTGFVTGGDALLALDKNGNGRIDGVAELFGDRTGARNGFEDLARYDSDGDGRIDRHDPVYERLRLFRDDNGDGRSSPDELLTLEEQGIASLSLHPVANPMTIAGNRITETATFTRKDGTTGPIAEVYFRYLDA